MIFEIARGVFYLACFLLSSAAMVDYWTSLMRGPSTRDGVQNLKYHFCTRAIGCVVFCFLAIGSVWCFRESLEKVFA